MMTPFRPTPPRRHGIGDRELSTTGSLSGLVAHRATEANGVRGTSLSACRSPSGVRPISGPAGPSPYLDCGTSGCRAQRHQATRCPTQRKGRSSSSISARSCCYAAGVTPRLGPGRWCSAGQPFDGRLCPPVRTTPSRHDGGHPVAGGPSACWTGGPLRATVDSTALFEEVLAWRRPSRARPIRSVPTVTRSRQTWRRTSSGIPGSSTTSPPRSTKTPNAAWALNSEAHSTRSHGVSRVPRNPLSGPANRPKLTGCATSVGQSGKRSPDWRAAASSPGCSLRR